MASPLLLLLLLFSIPICSSAASVNITQLIFDAGNHYTFVYLAQQTGLDAIVQANTASPGITIFVPSDAAFNAVPPGALSKLSFAQKKALMEYHALPSFHTMQSLSSLTVSSRLSTLASDNGGPDSYTLKVKTMSGGSILVSSDLLSSLVTSVIYSVDPVSLVSVASVLFPVDIFGSPALPPSLSPTFGSSGSPFIDSFAPSPAQHTSLAAHFVPNNAQILVIALLLAMLFIRL